MTSFSRRAVSCRPGSDKLFDDSADFRVGSASPRDLRTVLDRGAVNHGDNGTCHMRQEMVVAAVRKLRCA